MTNIADRYLELVVFPSQLEEMGKPPTSGWQLPYLHITLSGVDVIKKGLNCHPLDGNPALEVVEESISAALSSVTKGLNYDP